MPFAEKQLETRLPAADRSTVPGVGLFLVDDHLVGVIEVNKLKEPPAHLFNVVASVVSVSHQSL